MNYKVAIVGPTSVIAGFSALGAVPFPATTSEQAQEILEDLVARINNTANKSEDVFAVVIVVESLLRGITQKEYQKLTRDALPAIIAIPGAQGSSDYMRERLRNLTIRAIGADIM